MAGHEAERCGSNAGLLHANPPLAGVGFCDRLCLGDDMADAVDIAKARQEAFEEAAQIAEEVAAQWPHRIAPSVALEVASLIRERGGLPKSEVTWTEKGPLSWA